MRWILPRRYVCSTENLFRIRMKSVIPFCKKERETDQIQLQVIDNIVYASLNDLYDVQIEMMQENGNTQWEIIGFEWWPIEQKFYVEPMDGFYWEFQYQAGDTTYYWGKWSVHPSSKRCGGC